MALNIERILSQTGETIEIFSDEIGIAIADLKEYAAGTKKPSIEELEKISDYTGISMSELNGKKVDIGGIEIDPTDTWSPSQEAKDSLLKYIKEGIDSFDDDVVKIEIEKIQKCIRNWRKPKISVAGQSDTGKSTLINALIGGEKLPAKWTPTTSIIVYIKHISDKPKYITDDVWIFGKRNGELWNDAKLDDEEYCREFLVAKGDYSLLEEYGTHQAEKSEEKEAYSAVAFIDSKLLEDCDILDLPGFAANDEDDALHQFGSQGNIVDVLIYLSRSNGFLQDRDLDYLNLCMNSLRPIERKENNIGKLENLFIVAAQAGAINGGNVAELREIIETQNRKLCNINRRAAEMCAENEKVDTLLPRRTAITGYIYKEEDFRARFFTYEMKMPRLCKGFLSAFKDLIEKLPICIHNEFVTNLRNVASDSLETIKNKVNEYISMIEQRELYIQLVKEIKEKEPGRIIDQNAKNEKLMSTIDNLCIESKQLVQSLYGSYLCEDNLIREMEKNNCGNKKSDKQDFVSLIGNVLSEKVQSIINGKTEEFTARLNDYLESYSETLSYSGENEVDVEFDATNVFAMGVSAFGVLGASAAWLATSFTATIVTLFPEVASIGMFAAFGGVILIGIGAFIAGIAAIFKAATWKKKFAKSIIEAYEKEKYIEKMLEKIDTYWAETKNSVKAGAKKIEEEWAKKIVEFESLADEKKIPDIKEKIVILNQGIHFFEQMPLPDK